MPPSGKDRIRSLEEVGVFSSITSSLQHWFDPEEIEKRAQRILKADRDSSYATIDMENYARDCGRVDNRFPMLALKLSSEEFPLASSIQLRYRKSTGLVFCITSHNGEYQIHLRPSRGEMEELIEEIECCFNDIRFPITKPWKIREGYRLPFGTYKERTRERGTVEYPTDSDTAEFFYTLGVISSVGSILPAYMACLVGERDFDEFASRKRITPYWWRKNRDFYLGILKDLIPPLSNKDKQDSVDTLKEIFGERYIEDAGANTIVKLHKTHEYLSRHLPRRLSTLYRIILGEYQLIDRLSRHGNSKEWGHVRISLQRGI